MSKQKEMEIAERLKLLLLKRFETLLKADEMTATDAATLTRLLMENGWTLDASQLPKGLKDKVQGLSLPDVEDVDPDEVWQA